MHLHLKEQNPPSCLCRLVGARWNLLPGSRLMGVILGLLSRGWGLKPSHLAVAGSSSKPTVGRPLTVFGGRCSFCQIARQDCLWDHGQVWRQITEFWVCSLFVISRPVTRCRDRPVSSKSLGGWGWSTVRRWRELPWGCSWEHTWWPTFVPTCLLKAATCQVLVFVFTGVLQPSFRTSVLPLTHFCLWMDAKLLCVVGVGCKHTTYSAILFFVNCFLPILKFLGFFPFFWLPLWFDNFFCSSLYLVCIYYRFFLCDYHEAYTKHIKAITVYFKLITVFYQAKTLCKY